MKTSLPSAPSGSATPRHAPALASSSPVAPLPHRNGAPAATRDGAPATVAAYVLPERDEVLLPLEASARGFKSPLAFKRWCRRYGVPVYSTEKLLWVRPSEVSAGFARAACTTIPANDLTQLAAVSVARSVGGK